MEIIGSILGANVVLDDQSDMPGAATFGAYDPVRREIHITVFCNTSPDDILFTLFHEAAHRRQYLAGFLSLKKDEAGEERPFYKYWCDVEGTANKYAKRQLRRLGMSLEHIQAIVDERERCFIDGRLYKEMVMNDLRRSAWINRGELVGRDINDYVVGDIVRILDGAVNFPYTKGGEMSRWFSGVPKRWIRARAKILDVCDEYDMVCVALYNHRRRVYETRGWWFYKEYVEPFE